MLSRVRRTAASISRTRSSLARAPGRSPWAWSTRARAWREVATDCFLLVKDHRFDLQDPFQLGAGAGQIALGVEHPGQFMEGGGDGWDAPPCQRLPLRSPGPVPAWRGRRADRGGRGSITDQFMEGGGDGWMLLACRRRLPLSISRASVEVGAGAGQIALGVEHARQFVEGGGYVGVLFGAKDRWPESPAHVRGGRGHRQIARPEYVPQFVENTASVLISFCKCEGPLRSAPGWAPGSRGYVASAR